MAEILGTAIEKVITQIKKALLKATQEGSNLGIEVEKVELTLKAFARREAGYDLKVKIPIIDKELGSTGELSEEETQTIQITLEPLGEVELFGPDDDDIETDLVKSIKAIKEGVIKGAEEKPRFRLQSSSIELNFVVDKSGDISLVARGELKSQTTHTLKLFLRR